MDRTQEIIRNNKAQVKVTLSTGEVTKPIREAIQYLQQGYRVRDRYDRDLVVVYDEHGAQKLSIGENREGNFHAKLVAEAQGRACEFGPDGRRLDARPLERSDYEMGRSI